jgi:hypothetical protein
MHRTHLQVDTYSSQRHSMINHCDRHITLLSDTGRSFGLFNLLICLLGDSETLFTLAQIDRSKEDRCKKDLSLSSVNGLDRSNIDLKKSSTRGRLKKINLICIDLIFSVNAQDRSRSN